MDSRVYGLLIALVVICIICVGLLIASYVITSLGLYRVASRRNIANPWLAWVPVATNWVLGKLAEEYDEESGIRRRWSVITLTLSIVSEIGVIAWGICFVMITAAMGMRYGMEMPEETMLIWMLSIYIPIIICSIIVLVLAVCQMICMYKIFESSVPEKASKYWIIYLLVPLGGGICLLKSSKSILPQTQEMENIPL